MIDKILLPNPLQPGASAQQRQNPVKEGASAFDGVLGDKLAAGAVKLSQHAQERLAQRGISLNEADMKSLAGAVDDVARKGGKESLIMMGDAALVVSVTNRTVITAMDRKSMQGNVFTNIDSAVVI